MTAANLKNLKCGTQQGTHLSPEELCYVADHSFYGLGTVGAKQTAAAIAMAESEGWTGAVGDCTIGYSLGLWQIYAKKHMNTVLLGGDAFNAYDNAGMAAVVYETHGFHNWTTYWSTDGGKTNAGDGNGAYKTYLPQMIAAWPNRTKPGSVATTPSTNPGASPFSNGSVVSAAAESPVPGVNAAGQAVQTVTTAVSDTTSALASIGSGIAAGGRWLGNPHNWLRIAFVGLGGAVVIAGLGKLVGVNASTVASVVPGGKLASIAGAKIGTAQAGSAKAQYHSSRKAFHNYGSGG